MSARHDLLEKYFEKSLKPTCPTCNGQGKVEVEKGIGAFVDTCKTCSGYGYLLAKGNYVTHDQFQEILKKEEVEMYQLLFKLIWYLGLRVREVLGIRPMDINIPSAPDKLATYGVLRGTADSVKVWKTANRWRLVPLPKWLKEEILQYIKKAAIPDDKRIFGRNRTTVYQRLSDYGFSAGGKSKIGPESLRRGFGIWYLAEGGHLEDLMVIFDHSDIKLTQGYLAIDGRKGLKNFVEFQKSHSPYDLEIKVISTTREKMKRNLLRILGSERCVQCGESDIRQLEFDHIEGGGNAELRNFGSRDKMLHFYIEHPEIARERLQVLCVKHNRQKKLDNNEFSRVW